MTLFRLASLLRTNKLGFLPSGPGPERPHRSGKGTGQYARVEQEALTPKVAPSRYLQIPAPDTASMFATGEKILLRARRCDQPVNILVLHLHDLPELELVFGADAADEVIDEVMTHLTDIALKGGGVAARPAADLFTLLMPMQAEPMVSAIQAKLGKPCCIDFELEGLEIMLVPEVIVRSVGAAESVRDAYSSLCKDIIHARSATQRPRRKASCQRQFRTATVERPLMPILEKDIPAFYPPLPATIPVPLYSR